MEAFANFECLSSPKVLPKTSSPNIRIYASCIDYESPNNIADQKKEQYEQALEEIRDIKRNIASIHANVNDLKSKTERTPHDRRSADMHQYVPIEGVTVKTRY